MPTLKEFIASQNPYFDPHGLISAQQIRDSPNNKFGPLTLPAPGGKTITLSKLDATRLGLHTVFYDGKQWRNTRTGATLYPSQVYQINRDLAASDARYAGALANRKKGLKGFVSKSVGNIVPPGAKKGIQNIIEQSNLGSLATNLVRNPAFKAMAVVVPVTAPFVAAATAADKLISSVASGDPKAIAAAVATTVAAEAGDLGAARVAEQLELKGLSDVLKTAENMVPGGVKGAIDKVMSSMPSTPNMHFSVPATASPLAVASSASKLLHASTGAQGAPKKKVAQSLIKETISKARAGDASAQRGLAALSKAVVSKSGGGRGSVKLAKRPSKGQSFKNGFVIDAKTGIVYRGNFQAK